MNALQLRAKLQKLLSKELGTYSNGVPSIWVYGSANKPPSSSNGLEVLIKNVPGGAAQAASGGVKYKPQIWEVTLKNFKEDVTVVTVIRKIDQLLLSETIRICRKLNRRLNKLMCLYLIQ